MFPFLFVDVCAYIGKYHKQYSHTCYQRFSLENDTGYEWEQLMVLFTEWRITDFPKLIVKLKYK